MYLNFRIKVYIPDLIAWPFIAIALWYRRKKYGYTFRRIKLPKNKYAIVDPEDYQKLARDDWHLFESESKNYYAVRYENGKLLKMHRVITNAPKGKIVDHKNRDGLDNRKANLRIATRAQNQYNRRKTSKKTSSKYKGVDLDRSKNKYRAIISCDGKRIFLGYFNNEIDAAKAYDKAARIYHGEFAFLNLNQP